MVARLPSVGRDRDIVIERYGDPRQAAGWDEVVAAAGAPIFYSAMYLSAYQDHPLAELDRLGYLVVRAATTSAPLAVVPVALYQRPDPAGALRVIHPGIDTEPALLSHVWHCYDTRLVSVPSDRRRFEAVTAAVVDELWSLAVDWGARWFGFINVERGTPTSTALTAAGLPGDYLFARYQVDLAGVNDFESYLARLRHRGRSNFTRHERRAGEQGYTIDVTSPAAADLDEIVALNAHTAARHNNADFYPIDTFGKFVLALGPAARILQIRQYGRLVATGVSLVDDQRYHAWTCGVDYDVSGNASPYVVFFAELLRDAIRLGRPVFEGGRSNDAFKLRHGLTAHALDAHVARV